jgi:V8-like Glu-specific endopeptidase
MAKRPRKPKRRGAGKPTGKEAKQRLDELVERLGQHDRPSDPLFMPHLDLLEAAGMVPEGLGAEDDAYGILLESMCGATDDSQPVEQYDGSLGVPVAFVNTHQRAVGQVQWNDNLAAIYTNPGTVSGARWGTGTLISNDLFLTAGHLFDQTGGGWERPRQNGTTNIIPPSEIATNMHVNFNYQVDATGNPRPVQTFAITELIEYRLGGLDFAVCRLAGNPGTVFGQATVSTADAAIGDMLCIMGHPLGVPKRIEAGPTTDLTGTQITYNDIDTMGGNSGSGILRATNGRIVGVHTNGGCNTAGTGANFGMRITSILTQSPTLRGITSGVATAPALDATAVAADLTPKRKVTDDGPKFKFTDDGGTVKFADDGGSIKFADDGAGTRKALDDVKQPGLEKIPAADQKAPFDGRPGIDPRRPVERPFILSTPHHSTAVAGADEDRASYESVLAQLEQAMTQRQAELAQLDAEYRRLMGEYQARYGSQSGTPDV